MQAVFLAGSSMCLAFFKGIYSNSELGVLHLLTCTVKMCVASGNAASPSAAMLHGTADGGGSARWAYTVMWPCGVRAGLDGPAGLLCHNALYPFPARSRVVFLRFWKPPWARHGDSHSRDSRRAALISLREQPVSWQPLSLELSSTSG